MIRTAMTCAAMLTALTPVARADVVYQLVDLGHPDGDDAFISAEALNNTGDAAGFFFGSDDNYNAFLYADGDNVDISPPGSNRAFTRGMNDAGHVVGWTDYWPPQRAFHFDGENVINLGTLGGTYSEARDINNLGDIVGSAFTPPPEDDQHAALWRDDDITDLGTLGGPFSEALAISDTGLIVGWSWNEDWDRRAVYWTADLDGPIELPSFSPPQFNASAVAVNDAGVIVGSIQIPSDIQPPLIRAALWTNDDVVDLGVLPEAGEGESIYGGPALVSTSATGINSAGVIVGNSFPPADTPEVRHGPFIYEDGVMTNLNDLLHESAEGWMVTDVVAINDQGVIAGSARYDEGTRRAILLVPTEAGSPADFDGDGSVGVADLLVLLGGWGDCPPPPAGCTTDLDSDGQTGVSDLLILLAEWT
jgi:probable HAF family extracellular repeat protein